MLDGVIPVATPPPMGRRSPPPSLPESKWASRKNREHARTQCYRPGPTLTVALNESRPERPAVAAKKAAPDSLGDDQTCGLPRTAPAAVATDSNPNSRVQVQHFLGQEDTRGVLEVHQLPGLRQPAAQGVRSGGLCHRIASSRPAETVIVQVTRRVGGRAFGRSRDHGFYCSSCCPSGWPT